jgi:putative protein kinase ArgK-like GTPase of G3E family
MWNPPIVKTIATENQGIADLAEAIEGYKGFHKQDGDTTLARKQAIAKWRLL